MENQETINKARELTAEESATLLGDNVAMVNVVIAKDTKVSVSMKGRTNDVMICVQALVDSIAAATHTSPPEVLKAVAESMMQRDVSKFIDGLLNEK